MSLLRERPLVRVSTAALMVAALMVFAATASAGTPKQGYTDTPVAAGLDQPTGTAFLPDGKLLVTEKDGDLELLNGQLKTTLITLPVCTADEMGLLGIALDPSFAANGYVYLYRTKPGAGPTGCGDGAADRFNQVVRVTIANGAVEPGPPLELVPDIQTGNGRHNGGGLRIGPDGKLYIGVGEIGTPANSQTTNNCLGKVLRTELNGAAVAGNPFPGAGCPRIFALGLRNPFRFGFDPVTGRLWLGDVGGSAFEEIDIVDAGGNYGWPNCEGALGCGAGLTPPIFAYSHTPDPGSLGDTVIGGAFANFGAGYDYFFADYDSSKIYRAVPNAARDGLAGSPSVAATDAGGPVDLIAGPDGAIYYAAIETGELRRLASPSAGGGGPAAAPGGTDKTPPTVDLQARRVQHVGGLFVTVELDEPGTVEGRATVRTPGGTSRLYRFKPVKRAVAANSATRLKLKLRPKARRSVKRVLRGGLHKGRRSRARVTVSARDAAGNSSTSRVSIRLKP